MKGYLEPERFTDMTVFIVGGGSSLRGLDLERDLAGKIVIGCNDAYRLSCTRICCFGDSTWYKRNKTDLAEFEGEIWTNHSTFTEVDNIQWLRKRPHISTRPTECAWWGNTGYLALNLALLGHPKEIVMLGYDMCRIDELANWHDYNRGSPTDNDYLTMLAHNDEIVESVVYEYPDVYIVNANPVSRLSGFIKSDPSEYGIEVPADHIYRCMK